MRRNGAQGRPGPRWSGTGLGVICVCLSKVVQDVIWTGTDQRLDLLDRMLLAAATYGSDGRIFLGSGFNEPNCRSRMLLIGLGFLRFFPRLSERIEHTD